MHAEAERIHFGGMLRRWLAAAAIALTAWLAAESAEAQTQKKVKVLDRIVAVVDRDCITRRELDRAMAPHRARIMAELSKDAAARERAVASVSKDVLTMLVERRLFAKEAERARVQVFDKEIEDALAALAAQNKLSRAELLKQAAQWGYSEAAYRDELAAQILEAKLINIEAGRRFPKDETATDQAKEARRVEARRLLVDELRQQYYVEVRL